MYHPVPYDPSFREYSWLGRERRRHKCVFEYAGPELSGRDLQELNYSEEVFYLDVLFSDLHLFVLFSESKRKTFG